MKRVATQRTYRLLAPVGTFSTFLTVNMPSTTRPKTTCLPSRNSAGAQVMKNWQPLVPGPELAWGRGQLTTNPGRHIDEDLDIDNDLDNDMDMDIDIGDVAIHPRSNGYRNVSRGDKAPTTSTPW
jgi:hypothetical protein